MDIVVVGAGSLGSLIGGLLAPTHDVVLVGREPHVTRVARDGLVLDGELDRTVRPRAATDPPAGADLAVVTVKSYDTDGATATLADCTLEGCLSLQNGMGPVETLSSALSCPVLAGTCTYGARLVDPGRVTCTGVGDVTLGPPEGGESALASRVGAAFRTAGIETTVATDMPRHRFRKLAVNAGINATTALARVQNGELLEGPAGGTARRAAREAVTVAQARDVTLDADRVEARLTSVARTTARNRSSMLQDVEDGSRTEIDAINGYVTRVAADPVPVNETLTALLRAWEVGRGLR